MSQIAKGPNGGAMLALSNSEAAAQNRADRVLTNMRQQRADRVPGMRDKLVNGELDLPSVAASNSGITTQWDVPKQIPAGPNAGQWCIRVPADSSRIYQRDPRTGEETSRPSPEWAGAQIVEDDPSWWPEPEEDIV